MDRPQRLARKQERETARLHGGRVTPASGSGYVKNDVTSQEWSFEVKSTEQKGYRITREALERAGRNAREDGKRMAFVISFITGLTSQRYVVISEDDYSELCERHGTSTPEGIS